jgi:hypothetical protein
VALSMRCSLHTCMPILNMCVLLLGSSSAQATTVDTSWERHHCAPAYGDAHLPFIRRSMAVHGKALSPWKATHAGGRAAGGIMWVYMHHAKTMQGIMWACMHHAKTMQGCMLD